jgi:hypothetical protein
LPAVQTAEILFCWREQKVYWPYSRRGITHARRERHQKRVRSFIWHLTNIKVSQTPFIFSGTLVFAPTPGSVFTYSLFPFMMRANFYFFPSENSEFRPLSPVLSTAALSSRSVLLFHFFYFIISTLHCAVRKDSTTRLALLLIPFMSRILYYLVSNSLYLCLLSLLEKRPLCRFPNN